MTSLKQDIINAVLIILALVMLYLLQQTKLKELPVDKSFDVFYEYDVFGLDTIPVDTVYVVHKEIVK